MRIIAVCMWRMQPAPTLSALRCRLWHTHAQANNYRAAIQEYAQALEIDPNHFKSYFNKGFSHDKVSLFP